MGKLILRFTSNYELPKKSESMVQNSARMSSPRVGLDCALRTYVYMWRNYVSDHIYRTGKC